MNLADLVPAPTELSQFQPPARGASGLTELGNIGVVLIVPLRRHCWLDDEGLQLPEDRRHRVVEEKMIDRNPHPSSIGQRYLRGPARQNICPAPDMP